MPVYLEEMPGYIKAELPDNISKKLGYNPGWLINREKDVWLVDLGSIDGDRRETPLSLYVLCYQKHYIYIQGSGQGVYTADGGVFTYFLAQEVSIPQALSSQVQQILDIIKEISDISHIQVLWDKAYENADVHLPLREPIIVLSYRFIV